MTDKNLKNWLENSKLVDGDEPLLLFHGTHSDFTVFDLRYTDADNYLGRGFYFSDNYNDASDNYKDLNSPDRTSKKEMIWEKIEDAISNKYDKDSAEDVDDYIKVSEILNLINDYDEQGYSFNQKVDSMIGKIEDYIGINLEEMTELEFKEKLLTTIFKASVENKTLEVYVKMQNPLNIDKEHWDLDDVSYEGDMERFFENFRSQYKDMEDVDDLIENIKHHMQFYMVMDDNTSGYVSKSSVMEILEMDDIDDTEDKGYSKELLEAFFEFWDSDLETEELYGEFINNSKTCLFYKYILDRNILPYESSEAELSKVLGEIQENQITLVADIITKFKESYVFLDMDSSEHMFGNIFHDFVESIGYDGIVMSADVFKNMKEVKNTKHYIVRNPLNIKLADGTNESFSLTNPDIRFRMIEEKPDNSIDLGVAIKEIESFQLQFPNLPYTRLFKSGDDAISYTKTNEDCAGFFIDNRANSFVGIILENIKDKNDLRRTLIHEHFGHASLKDILGKEYQPTMLGIYSYLEKKGVVQNKNISLQEKVIEAEEHFAKAIETNSEHKITLIKRVVSKVMKLTRVIFPELPVIKSEIDDLMVRSVENAKKQKRFKI